MNPKIEELHQALNAVEDAYAEAKAEFGAGMSRDTKRWYEERIADAKYNLAIEKLRQVREGLEAMAVSVAASECECCIEQGVKAYELIAEIWGEEQSPKIIRKEDPK